MSSPSLTTALATHHDMTMPSALNLTFTGALNFPLLMPFAWVSMELVFMMQILMAIRRLQASLLLLPVMDL